jgi:hypothetical protein
MNMPDPAPARSAIIEGDFLGLGAPIRVTVRGYSLGRTQTSIGLKLGVWGNRQAVVGFDEVVRFRDFLNQLIGDMGAGGRR